MKHQAESAQALSMNVEFVDCVLMPLLGPLVNFLPQQQVRRRAKREERMEEREKGEKKREKGEEKEPAQEGSECQG